MTNQINNNKPFIVSKGYRSNAFEPTDRAKRALLEAEFHQKKALEVKSKQHSKINSLGFLGLKAASELLVLSAIIYALAVVLGSS